MALISCPDCNHNISTLALSCPHCGRPSGKTIQPKIWSTESGVKFLYTRIVGCLFISGILSGLILEFLPAFSRFDWLPGDFRMQWLPGFLFGAAIVAATRTKAFMGLTYATITGVIYYSMTIVYILISDPFDFSGPNWRVLVAGSLAGGLGSILVSAVTSRFVDRKISVGSYIPILFAGSMAGIWLGYFGEISQPSQLENILWLSGWTVWQVPVGYLMYKNIAKGSNRTNGKGSFEERLASYLDSPISKIIGLVGTILTILSVLGVFSG
jgi:hypothetical protein